MLLSGGAGFLLLIAVVMLWHATLQGNQTGTASFRPLSLRQFPEELLSVRQVLSRRACEEINHRRNLIGICKAFVEYVSAFRNFSKFRPFRNGSQKWLTNINIIIGLCTNTVTHTKEYMTTHLPGACIAL